MCASILSQSEEVTRNYEIRSMLDGTGQQLRSGKMAGTRMQNAMVGACHAVRARRDAPATPDCLMARIVPSKL